MEAQQATNEAQTDKITAEALRHAGKCILQLVKADEPMGPQQTYRRGFNAADEFVCDSPATGRAFEQATDKVGDVTVMALKHNISGEQAAEFYYNQAQTIDPTDE